MPAETIQPRLVSIVIPTYNQSGFLLEALSSVRSQSYRNWEAIVVNNFSNDETVSVVEAFQDSRISLVNFANNGVIARSRNAGISLARGEFVAFLDSDDFWEAEKIARCVRRLEEGFDLVCHAERWFGGGRPDRVVRYGPSTHATFASLLTRGNCISTSATMVRRDVLTSMNGFRDREEFITTEDYDLWLRIARNGYRITFIDEILGSYRRHAESASSSTARHLSAELAVLNDHFLTVPSELKKRQTARIAFAHYSAARSFSKNAKTSDATKSFLHSLKLDPFSTRTWVGLILHIGLTVFHFSRKPRHHGH